ncbi:glycine/D-amino acid oxidase-like deaminating enzyme [Ciceribacter lividus]|uniref:Glycine/D-amino acid oxidase-like deaminating enzyme n=1 Tax=Ciceribacter lividus TaxID=1197950 RepID=A0A6I7HQQ4_9HYPH|nr:FAD-binding oxidoreductase [Ciceribacter lividus]RCW28104.1 glycine/D-amino acid oxidase-like deaminating enzyme [Ciceribacter lividus]
MHVADTAHVRAGQSRVGLLIVGGGVMGLWAAVRAERRGIDTLLIDSGQIGRGASGGLMGALMPHMPDNWSDKKQFQFEALVSLEEEIASLERETGVLAGYRRSGRLIPLPKPHLRVIAEKHEKEAGERWIAGDRSFAWSVRDVSPCGNDWPAAEHAASGLVFDTLAAHVFPRRVSALLGAFLRSARHVRIREGAELDRFDAARGIATLSTGEEVVFGHAIVAAGYRSFPILEALGAPLPRPLGQPVKGQAALLQTDVDPDLPLLYLDGLYVVPHEGGRVAVGSTSENRFADPFSTDAQLDEVVARARVLAPVLENADVVERWAGLRPKAIDRDPMVGEHPDHRNVIALTGGFKVSFGLAHRLADAALQAVEGGAPVLPTSFHLSSHVAVASR